MCRRAFVLAYAKFSTIGRYGWIVRYLGGQHLERYVAKIRDSGRMKRKPEVIPGQKSSGRSPLISSKPVLANF
jgi:hypothetical protein